MRRGGLGPVAPREQDQQRVVGGGLDQQPQRPEGRRVGPVQVVEDEDERLLGRRAAHPGGDLLPGAELVALADLLDEGAAEVGEDAGEEGADGEAGVAWDWVMLSRDVVAMADPMCVVTNLRLLGDHGEVLTSWEAARHLSRIVYGLPWQGQVQAAVQRHLND